MTGKRGSLINPLTLPPDSHTHTEIEITDLDHATPIATHATVGAAHHAVFTPTEHTAIGDGAPHHAAATIGADAAILLTLAGQEFQFVVQNANKVLAGPAAGGDADPTFRSLVAADIPDISATYQAVSEKDAANGYAGLDATPKLAVAQIRGLRESGGQALDMGAVADGEFLKRVGNTIIGAAAGGATAYDDIGAPDANSTIAFAGFTNIWTSTLDGGSVFTISNTDADLAARTELLKLSFTDDGDAEGIFLACYDNAGADKLMEIGQDGHIGIPDDHIYRGINITKTFAVGTAVQGIVSMPTSTGPNITGVYGMAKYTGAVANRGSYGLEYHSYYNSAADGVSATAIFVNNQMISSGNVVTMRGLYIQAPSILNAGRPTTSYGAWIEDQGKAGITTTYGLKIDDQTGSTNGYLIEAGPATPYMRLLSSASWTPAASETPLYLACDAAPNLNQVTIGAADSGGAGFRVLRVPN